MGDQVESQLRRRRSQHWCAIGGGSAAALRRAGVDRVDLPQRMDSEGLLALPIFADVAGRRVGVLTAPGGRDRIVPTLQARGAQVLRVDVYARVPMPPNPATLARLRADPSPWLLPVSSGEALQRSFAAAPADIAARLRKARVAVSSARLAQIARDCGCRDIRTAAGPRPRDLLAAALSARERERRTDNGPDHLHDDMRLEPHAP